MFKDIYHHISNNYNQINIHNIEDYFYTIDNSDNNISNQKLYYLFLIYYDLYKSEFLSYKTFKKIDFNYLSKNQNSDIFQKVFNIFSSETLAKKATGTNLNYKGHVISIKKIKYDLLVNSLIHCVYDEHFEEFYSDFFKTQTFEDWNLSSFKILEYEINNLDLTKINIFSSSPLIKLLRTSSLTIDKLTEEDLDNFSKVVPAFFSSLCNEEIITDEQFESIIKYNILKDNIREYSWILFFYTYYLARKDAENCFSKILTLFSYITTFEKKYDVREIKMLAFLSLSNYKYRTNSTGEAMLFLIASLKISLEIKELSPFIELGSLIITKFFTENYNHKDLKFLNKYHNFYKKLTGNPLKELSFILDKDSTMQKYEKLYSQNKCKPEDIFNLSQLYSLKVDYPKAAQIIYDNFNTLIEFFHTRRDIISHALTYILEISVFTPNLPYETKMQYSYKIINLLFYCLEEIRSDFKFYNERAIFFDKHVHSYKTCLYIFIYIFSIKKNFTDFPLGEKLFSVFSLRALYENKLNSFITNDPYISSLERFYIDYSKTLKDFKNNSDKKFNNLKRRYQKIDTILKSYSPNFKELIPFNVISIETLQKNLKDNEIIYQFLVYKLGFLMYLIIKKEDYSFGFSDTESFDFNDLDFRLGITAQTIPTQNFSKDIIANVNNHIFSPLIKELEKKLYDDIFIIQDLDLKYISQNFMEFNNAALVNQSKSISYLTNFNAKLNQNKSCSSDINIIITGSTPELDIFKKTINNSNITLNEKAETLIIIGHGVSSLNYKPSPENKGALFIKSHKKEISLTDLLNNNPYVKNLIILSCSSGISLNNQIDSNHGILGQCISSKNISNALLCKWDVSIKATNSFLHFFLKNNKKNKSFNEKIQLTKQNLINNNELLINWGGFELWNF